LSARKETFEVELLKFGETCKMAIPSEARKGTCRDLTGSTCKMVKIKSRPQTTNYVGSENCSW